MPLSTVANSLRRPVAADDPTPSFEVLIIDDQATAREILAAIVLAIDPRARVRQVGDPVEAMAWAAGNDVDFVLTDLRMPMVDGVEVIRTLRGLPHCQDIPVVVVTMVDDKAIRYAALEAGATDFLNKPLDQRECLVRCRNLMTLRQQQRLLRHRALHLQTQVDAATAELEGRELQTLLMLAKAGEHRDSDTGNHVVRVAKLSGLIARRLRLDEAPVIQISALLHDIGKIGIPDHILLKPGRLTDTEMIVMREHAAIGHSILSEGKTHYTAVGAEIAISHHENFDGSGYPKGLAGELIPISGRIVAVADTLDALVSPRPYKNPWQHGSAFAYIAAQSGGLFDPACVRALLDSESDARNIIDSHQ